MKDDQARISHIKLSRLLKQQEENNNLDIDDKKGFAKKPNAVISEEEFVSLRLMKLVADSMKVT